VKDFVDEFTGLIFIAVFVTIFVISFRAGFKMLAAKLPFPAGLQELLAS
jgi:hypothetical protein